MTGLMQGYTHLQDQKLNWCLHWIVYVMSNISQTSLLVTSILETIHFHIIYHKIDLDLNQGGFVTQNNREQLWFRFWSGEYPYMFDDALIKLNTEESFQRQR